MEWLASSLDECSGAQNTSISQSFLLFSFYHGVLQRSLDVLAYSGFSTPDLSSSYDPWTEIKPPSSPEHLWMCCQSLVFRGLVQLECGLPASRNKPTMGQCLLFPCSQFEFIEWCYRYVFQFTQFLSDLYTCTSDAEFLILTRAYEANI